MKNFTSYFFKQPYFIFILLSLFSFASFNAVGAGTWNATYYRVASQNTVDGRAQIDVLYQLVGGDGSVIPSNADLYLQYQNSNGNWVNCMRIYQSGTRRYSFYGMNGVSVSTSGTQTGFFGGAGQYYTNVTIYSNPSDVYNAPVNFRWYQVTRGEIGNSGFTLTFYKPDPPTNVQVSSNICNRIDLTWENPANESNGAGNSYKIYVDGSYYATTRVMSWSMNNPLDGVSYDFQVSLVEGSYEGFRSSIVAGNSKPIPVSPTNVKASTDDCDGEINITWQWSGTPPENYAVYRSTNKDYGFASINSSIAGNINSLTDTPPNRNTPYFYKVIAKNDCGDWGDINLSSAAEGVAPDVPGDPSNVNSTVANNIVSLTWIDNSAYEDKYEIVRTNLNTGVANTYEVDENVTAYDDSKAQLCVPYEYEIKAVNACGSSNVVSSGTVTLTPDLAGTFPAGSFKASKGFYPDIVHLEWNNQNRNQINAYYIYRKIFGANDSTLLATLDGALASYDDKYAENGILYEYSILGEGLCDSISVWSNGAADIGFRNPSATVSGKITYGSGEPVKGITVTAESTDELETTSLALNGSSSYLEITDKANADIQDQFAFQAFVRLSEIKASAIFNKGNQYRLDYTGTAFEFSVGSDVLSFAYAMPIDTFVHVSVVFDGSASSLYLNGKLMQTKSPVSGAANNTSPFVIGRFNSSNYLNGYIDEIRIWKQAIDSTKIKNDYRRYISYRDNGLIAYFRLNENINSDLVFDISKTSSAFNENHGVKYNTPYSAVVPEKEQLWFRGLSDINGDYLITGIPYFTDGSSFNIVPSLAPHEFNPGSKTLFVSDNSQVHNNIDFIDKSSFMVNGSVKYRNTDLGVAGVQVLVDNQLIFDTNGKPETTDANGLFEILVPIGYHYISLKKPGHSFADGGRYPYNEAYPDSIVRHNFSQNLTFGEPFIDTTLITVVGRVIGGTGSNEIPFGFQQSVNNIGKATITITHNSSSDLTFDNEGDGLGRDTVSYSYVSKLDTSRTYTNVEYFASREQNTTQIFTSEATGEFVAKLIPEKFSIVEIKVDNDNENKIKNFFGNKVIDLSANPTEKAEYLYDENGQLLDSLKYHIKLNYIYQTPPEIDVTNIDDSLVFYGEKEIPFTDPSNGNQVMIQVADHFRYPIFNMMKSYSPKISVFESYENYDKAGSPARFTRQSIKEAEIKIINDLAITDNIKTYQLTPSMDGVVIDTFKVGIPNIGKSEVDKTSFTKTMQINVTVDGNSFPWKPNGQFYRAYITGQRPKGNNFYTEGQQIPEIILRDPPGSKSSAYIEKGSSYTVSSKYSTDFDNGSGFGVEVLLGVEMAAGGGLAGPVIKTDNKNSGKTGLNFSTSVNENGEYVQTYEFSERIETSSDPGVVGSMGDVYIGKSYNYFYGETDHLKILPKALADANGVEALGSGELKDTEYTLGIVEGFIMNPDNRDTYFKYTQAHLLNKLLPELESRRNNLFLTSRRSDGTLKYQSKLESPTDIRYGIAHSYDAVISGGDTTVHAYFKMTDTDSIETYSFRPEKQTIQDLNNIKNDTIYEIDSVRYYNKQIEIWIDAIRLNEAEKAIAIEKNNPEQNISFDGAVGSISRKEVQTISYNKAESRTKNMNFNAAGSLGFKFNGIGVIATGTLNISHSMGIATSENVSQTMEYGYTLEDGNVGDYYSINVFRRDQNGVYSAKKLEETKLSMPSNFEWGILGGAVGGAAGASGVFIGTLVGAFAASSTLGAIGAGTIIGMSGAMSLAAGLSYIPYVSFQDKVKEKVGSFEPGEIRISSFDISSPIFQTLGGQTMCPYQDMEYTFFYKDAQGDSVVLHKATLQREKPEITAEPRELFNVPVTDPAIFTIKLTNNTESGDDQWYTVDVFEKSNPNGAAVKIDGVNANKTILVPAGETVSKLLTITPTNKSIMDYENIGIVIHSTCQYDPTDFMPEISDTVFISAHFQAACTNVEILEPLDKWVVNADDNDTLTIRLGGYNLAHNSFQGFRFEYKPSSGSIWIPVKYFVTDPLLANKDEIQDTVLINNQPSVAFEWDMTALKDREYDLRAVSVCSDGSENESIILSGILDGQRPQVFGTPQPADGILNIDENISVQFNEPIETGLLNDNNFDMKGTLNNYQLKHEAFLRLNGTSDYADIPEGISFNNKSFTIEFWARTDTYRDAVIFSQGNDNSKSIEIGLRGNNKTFFKLGGVEFEAPFQFSSAVPAEAWQHFAYVFDYENGDVFIYQNDKIILEVRGANVLLNNSGKIYLGKSSLTNGDHYAGSLHELRIWSKFLDMGEVYANQYTALSGNEVGLYGYWPMDEAFGDLAIDKAANRHAGVYAPWGVYPGGSAWDFSGNNLLEFYTGYFSIIPEMDFTLEFWFKDNNPADTVWLFSNQKGDGKEGDLLDKALSIYATPDGKIWVASKGHVFEAVTKDYFDNSWHHFALVLRRRGNIVSYIDGEPQNNKENTLVGGIAGANMVLGARKWNNIASGSGEDHYYSGKMDEFRLWNMAKSNTQIRMDMSSKLQGTEIGLMVYFPFEAYYKDSKGVVSQTPTLENVVEDVNAADAIPAAGNAFTTDAPNMKDVRPVQTIAFDHVASEDKIILNPKAYLFPQLEKNIIEITVEKVEDKYGNRMASPVTWTAYVHRNQVRWEDERRYFTKEIYKPLTFVSTIKNTGGQQIAFDLLSLPAWLTAYPVSGIINPESTREIVFTVNPALNIGEYNHDIILRTENGFDEKLPLTVKVYKTPPDWKVDPNHFEHTMNMVGQVKIEGVISTDIFDKVAVFVNDSIRGVANVRYVKEFDNYMVFLNVYGNLNGQALDFRIWDSSVGQMLDNVNPSDLTFVPNGVEGNTINPVLFEAIGLYRQYIPLAKGWNWLSFNKLAANQNNLNSFFGALEPSPGDQAKTHGLGYINYVAGNGWIDGNIDSIDNRRMYQMKISKADTIVYSGQAIVPENTPLNLQAGWNHISYLPDMTMDVNDALRMYVADTSEIIKSQYAFSMYDPRVGWLGTLDVMQPGLGYMIHVRKDATLTYPNSTIFKGAQILYAGSSPPPGWSNDLSGYESNMSVVARIDVANNPDVTLNNQMVLGAFINDVNHGFVSPISTAGLGYDPFLLTVNNSLNGQLVEFRLYDGTSGKTYTLADNKPFVQNGVFGSVQSPLVLTLKGVLTGNTDFDNTAFLRCYPNPFNDQINVEFSGTPEAVSIDVVNATGAKIRRIYDGYPANGTNTAVWDGRNQNGAVVTSGIYYIRFISGNTVETIKISKTK